MGFINKQNKTVIFPVEACVLVQKSADFFGKNEKVSILGFACGHVPYKTLFTKASSGWIWSMAHSFLTHILGGRNRMSKLEYVR